MPANVEIAYIVRCGHARALGLVDAVTLAEIDGRGAGANNNFAAARLSGLRDSQPRFCCTAPSSRVDGNSR
jgi:hypothetical protein